jgi:hypothetical protein
MAVLFPMSTWGQVQSWSTRLTSLVVAIVMAAFMGVVLYGHAEDARRRCVERQATAERRRQHAAQPDHCCHCWTQSGVRSGPR